MHANVHFQLASPQTTAMHRCVFAETPIATRKKTSRASISDRAMFIRQRQSQHPPSRSDDSLNIARCLRLKHPRRVCTSQKHCLSEHPLRHQTRHRGYRPSTGWCNCSSYGACKVRLSKDTCCAITSSLRTCAMLCDVDRSNMHL